MINSVQGWFVQYFDACNEILSNLWSSLKMLNVSLYLYLKNVSSGSRLWSWFWVLHLKRLTKLIFINTSPYQKPTTILLVTELKWRCHGPINLVCQEQLSPHQVHKTFKKYVFRYFLARSWCYSWSVLSIGNQISAFLTMALTLSTDHLVLALIVRLQFWNMTALEDSSRILVFSCLILLKSLAVNVCPYFLTWFL